MRLSLTLASVVFLLAAAPAPAAIVHETHRVPTVGGAEIAVEIMRDAKTGKKAPVLLTLSPYNTLYETRSGSLANDAYGQRYVPRGYVRAVADVLGTRNSSGCWDYGGPLETQAGVDLVKWLASQKWSNGRVGMIGTSYDGTTANMVASRGAEVPELKAIVPIAAISRWYGYAYKDGVRYFLNSEVPSDEGFDTPFAFDFGLARTPPTDVGDAKFFAKLRSRVEPCESQEHTERGYDPSPDYDAFWKERDYVRHASQFRAAALIAHGWQDYNVKQEEGVDLFEALQRSARHSPLVRLFAYQAPHDAPEGERWQKLLDGFLDRYLLRKRTGVERTPAVMTEGRTVTDSGSYASTGFRAGGDATGGRDLRLWLRRTFDQDIPGVTVPNPGTGETGVLARKPNPEPVDNIFTWIGAPTSEELGNRDPLNEPGHGYYSLFFGTEPLDSATRILGSPVLDGWFRTEAGAHLSPVLVDVAPNGRMTTIARGFLNMDYREGLAEARPRGRQWVHAAVEFLPQDVTVAKGHRIGLLVQSSNTVWAVPGMLGPNNVATGPVPDVTRTGTSLVLPLA
ncbi:MAG TPA: CocE/NonD family hydrolase [Solirubrobacteraceae bacterium]|nr:CocE/NonD family hydrolase [Solirubrobacteraceae bacterium]